MSDAKRVLRARLRAERITFAMSSDAVIVPPSAFLDRLHAGMVVASYIPVGSEADPTPLATAAKVAGCTIVLPHVTSRADPIRFLEWDVRGPLASGPFGLRQPDTDAAELRPDVILTPLLGFDAQLNRLGQGAGHYDRAFEACPDAWRLGVAWSCQQVDALAVDPWDVPLHAIVTEQGLMP